MSDGREPEGRAHGRGRRHLDDVIRARLSRRRVLEVGATAAAVAFLGRFGLDAYADEKRKNGPAKPPGGSKLNFRAVAKNLDDVVTLDSEAYTWSVLLALGDPLAAGVPDYKNDGTDTDFDRRSGDHHDGMHFFGVDAAGEARDPKSSARGLLVVNHENVTRAFLHPKGATNRRPGSGTRPADEVVKEIAAHGVSVVEVRRAGRTFEVVRNSRFNRRITPETDMELSGPVRGSALVRTRHDPTGVRVRGTLNNCANGFTPWGTYLTCEENWAGYFAVAEDEYTRRGRKVAGALHRYDIAEKVQDARNDGAHRWAFAEGDRFARWNASPVGTSEDGTDDFRNEPNTFGWVVEIDPFDPASKPRKRTAMGRFAHECAGHRPPVAGRKLAYYMGDDSVNEYVYKFVSAASWDPADSDKGGLALGDKYLDQGTLHVAVFGADGTGEWIPLTMAHPKVASGSPYPFADLADVLVHARIAADVVGATPMDRPEWCAVNPENGDVYVTLTNNKYRASEAVDAANPRAYALRAKQRPGNLNGHILRIAEEGGAPDATKFAWDVFVFGAPCAADAAVNLSGLTADNDFSSPDGIAFGRNGVLWIETDDSAYTDVTNCMLLAALPGRTGDGGAHKVANAAGDKTKEVTTYKGRDPTADDLRRFLVGPRGCEITGIAETPDGRALFVNVQHPGAETRTDDLGDPAKYQSHWPDGGSARPRSATIVITRKDGGTIGV